MAKNRRSFHRKPRKNNANKEARQKARTKKLFKPCWNNTIVTLPAGVTITVLGSCSKELKKYAVLSPTRHGTLVKAKVDLLLTVDGNGLRNKVCHAILFCRPDEGSSGKKVHVPKSLTYNQYDIKTMNWSGETPVHILGGHTAALLYKKEFLVPCPGTSDYFWITNRVTLKQISNLIKRQQSQAA